MPIWSEILVELQKTATSGPPDYDKVRRQYIQTLYKHTERNVILYASGWLQKPQAASSDLMVNDEDIQALMEVSQGLTGDNLDLILHSPGGSLEAAEAIVAYLRSRFSHIRVFVPHLAMSAATMISCAADKIVLGKHSFLGPTDPQISISGSLGNRMVPAKAILEQFRKAQQECADPKKLAAWIPMLSQYGPDLLMRCETAQALSRELVKNWLQAYMFQNQQNSANSAEKISDWLANHQNWKSHGRHINREDLVQQGLAITNLEDDAVLQDACLSVFHATTHTFTGTTALKIVENHTGRAFIKHQIQSPQIIPGAAVAPILPKIPPRPA